MEIYEEKKMTFKNRFEQSKACDAVKTAIYDGVDWLVLEGTLDQPTFQTVLQVDDPL
ncbi:hypothetical protein CHUAL_004064 [Chamberlinius hualienensis]